MINIKITAQLQNGNRKESSIIGIFDFIPFVKILPDNLKKYQIQRVEQNESDILSNLLDAEKQKDINKVLIDSKQGYTKLYFEIIQGRTIYFSLDYTGILIIEPHNISVIEPQLEVPIKIGDKLKISFRNDTIGRGSYIDFFAKDDDLVYSDITKKMHCGRIYIDTQKKCKIIFSTSLNATRRNIVSLKTIEILEDIGTKTNNDIIIITSTIRYPQQQAEAMYSNLSRGKRIRYRKPGMLVTEIYDDYTLKGATKEEIINAMTKKIEQLSETNQRVSLHCVSENIYKKCNVLDVSTKMNNAKEFINLLSKKSSVTKIIHPIKGVSNSSTVIFDTSEGAIHIEIKQ